MFVPFHTKCPKILKLWNFFINNEFTLENCKYERGGVVSEAFTAGGQEVGVLEILGATWEWPLWVQVKEEDYLGVWGQVYLWFCYATFYYRG